jgi:hypothetical protein
MIEQPDFSKREAVELSFDNFSFPDRDRMDNLLKA